MPEGSPGDGFWGRIAAGAALIVLTAAAASAALAFNELDKLVAALGQGRTLDLGRELALADSG